MGILNANALLALALAGIAAFISYGKVQRWKGEAVGASAVIAEMEKKDNAAAQKIREADQRSTGAGRGRVRGLRRDPNAVSQ